MNRLARELYDWVVKHGYGELTGRDGHDHLVYTLRNGKEFRTSSTPSKPSAIANGRAQIRRLLGISSESPKSGKHRFVKTNGYDGTPTRRGGWAMPDEVTEMLDELAQVDKALLSLNVRREPQRARHLAEKRNELKAALERYGIAVDEVPHRR